jgi:hypothetical protein
MKHAREDYNRFQDPEGKIPADEPVFLLRAQDKVAPDVVEAWASLAEIWDADKDIVQRAREHAQAMRRWQDEHGCKIPDLPKPDSSG